MPTIESIKLFVEMKKGVAIVPRMCVEPEIAHGLLRELRMKQMRIQRRLYLVYRQDRPLTASARALVQHTSTTVPLGIRCDLLWEISEADA